MKPFTFIVSILLLILFVSTSCSKEKSTQTEEYIIKVDSVQVTDNVKIGDKITIAFFGIIGYNGCSSFSRYIVNSKDSTHTVTVIGKRKVGENLICTENLPLLNGMTLEIPTDSIGIYTIEIVNPGINNFLTKKINVIP